jgi:hypothetical protein
MCFLEPMKVGTAKELINYLLKIKIKFHQALPYLSQNHMCLNQPQYDTYKKKLKEKENLLYPSLHTTIY